MCIHENINSSAKIQNTETRGMITNGKTFAIETTKAPPLTLITPPQPHTLITHPTPPLTLITPPQPHTHPTPTPYSHYPTPTPHSHYSPLLTLITSPHPSPSLPHPSLPLIIPPHPLPSLPPPPSPTPPHPILFSRLLPDCPVVFYQFMSYLKQQVVAGPLGVHRLQSVAVITDYIHSVPRQRITRFTELLDLLFEHLVKKL